MVRIEYSDHLGGCTKRVGSVLPPPKTLCVLLLGFHRYMDTPCPPYWISQIHQSNPSVKSISLLTGLDPPQGKSQGVPGSNPGLGEAKKNKADT
jgi:hypothetical protein